MSRLSLDVFPISAKLTSMFTLVVECVSVDSVAGCRKFSDVLVKSETSWNALNFLKLKVKNKQWQK